MTAAAAVYGSLPCARNRALCDSRCLDTPNAPPRLDLLFLLCDLGYRSREARGCALSRLIEPGPGTGLELPDVSQDTPFSMGFL